MRTNCQWGCRTRKRLVRSTHFKPRMTVVEGLLRRSPSPWNDTSTLKLDGNILCIYQLNKMVSTFYVYRNVPIRNTLPNRSALYTISAPVMPKMPRNRNKTSTLCIVIYHAGYVALLRRPPTQPTEKQKPAWAQLLWRNIDVTCGVSNLGTKIRVEGILPACDCPCPFRGQQRR